MTSPEKPWETANLQNSTHIIRNTNPGPSMPQLPSRSAPVLPPRPNNSSILSNGFSSPYNSYMNYSGYGGGYGGGYGYGSSYGMPYRSSMYNSFGGMNSYGGLYGGGYGGMCGGYDDAERRFIQYAEESSRNTFASVEGIVRAFNSIAMMLDNTFFAMTSSFRAVLSVAENFGRLRSMFGQIWYTVNVFRFISWAYAKLCQMMGLKVAKSASSLAWREAAQGAATAPAPPGGSSWPTLAFLGMLLGAPYIISKFIPKYEDKSNPDNWKTPGIRAKVVFDFIATNPNEMTVQTNDIITLAPTYIQEEMKLKNTGWVFAVFNGKSGLVPLNYIVISKSKPITGILDNSVPVPRAINSSNSTPKTHTKRVSFGETQIFENIDLEDYKKEVTVDDSKSSQNDNSDRSKSNETTSV